MNMAAARANISAQVTGTASNMAYTLCVEPRGTIPLPCFLARPFLIDATVAKELMEVSMGLWGPFTEMYAVANQVAQSKNARAATEPSDSRQKDERNTKEREEQARQ
jgi:hypothetical protein